MGEVERGGWAGSDSGRGRQGGEGWAGANCPPDTREDESESAPIAEAKEESLLGATSELIGTDEGTGATGG